MGTGTHHHDTAFSIVKALGIVAVVISHAAILTPLETFTYYFNTAVFFFVAGYFFDDGQTAAPGRFIGRSSDASTCPTSSWARSSCCCTTDFSSGT